MQLHTSESRAAGGGPSLVVPAAGEHTVAVLSDLDVPADEIDALLTAKVVRQP
ncbi:MAG TPA: hypothetical protein VK611_21470 [Acidimicrobiales bacterium]|nr:hypothetical protein [Acidimicrobiales bacterium]